MKKQMKRTVYEAPVTERFSVELEGSFMNASITDDDQGKVTGITSGAQEYESFEGGSGFVSDENGIKWD